MPEIAYTETEKLTSLVLQDTAFVLCFHCLFPPSLDVLAAFPRPFLDLPLPLSLLFSGAAPALRDLLRLPGCGHPQHGLSPSKMALITSDCDENALPEHQMALTSPDCAPLVGTMATIVMAGQVRAPHNMDYHPTRWP